MDSNIHLCINFTLIIGLLPVSSDLCVTKCYEYFHIIILPTLIMLVIDFAKIKKEWMIIAGLICIGIFQNSFLCLNERVLETLPILVYNFLTLVIIFMDISELIKKFISCNTETILSLFLFCNILSHFPKKSISRLK